MLNDTQSYSGIYNKEDDNKGPFHWMSQHGVFELSSVELGKFASVILDPFPTLVGTNLTLNVGDVTHEFVLTGGLQLISVPVAAGQTSLEFKFSTVADIPGEVRTLCARLRTFVVGAQEVPAKVAVMPSSIMAWYDSKGTHLEIDDGYKFPLDETTYVDIILTGNDQGSRVKVTAGGWQDEIMLCRSADTMIGLAIPTDVLKTARRIDLSKVIYFNEISIRNNFYDYLGLWSFNSTEANIAAEKSCLSSAANTGLFAQWFVTWKCNYSCKYCWQEENANSYRGERISRRKPEEWAAKFNEMKLSHLYFTGGEPSLYKELPQLISMLDPNIGLLMTTNLGGSFNVDRFVSLVPPGRFVELMASCHPTQIDYAEFIGKMRQLRAAGFTGLGVEMVMYPENIECAEPLIRDCRELGIKLRFDRFVPAGTYQPLDGALLQRIDGYIEQANEVTSVATVSEVSWYDSVGTSAPTVSLAEPDLGSLRNKAVLCPAGSSRINIDGDGQAFPCMSSIDRAKLFGIHALPHYRPIGNIFDADFRLFDRPVVCWEAFRCSACDYQVLAKSWRTFKADRTFPLPE